MLRTSKLLLEKFILHANQSNLRKFSPTEIIAMELMTELAKQIIVVVVVLLCCCRTNPKANVHLSGKKKRTLMKGVK